MISVTLPSVSIPVESSKDKIQIHGRGKLPVFLSFYTYIQWEFFTQANILKGKQSLGY